MVSSGSVRSTGSGGEGAKILYFLIVNLKIPFSSVEFISSKPSLLQSAEISDFEPLSSDMTSII